MKLLIQKTDETKGNIKKIELTSSDFENNINTYIIKENETPVIYFTDTEKSYLINDIEFKLKRINSEAILKITESDLISLSSINLTNNLTKNEVSILKNTNSLIPGLKYTITNADVNLYGGTEITLTAITNTELSLQGSGKFFCPKYDLSAEGTGYGIWTTYMEGTFSSVVGNFLPNELVVANNGATAIYLANGFLSWVSGDFSTADSIQNQDSSAEANISGFVSPEYTMGSIVHWGGKSWTNRSGNVGSSIDKYTLDAEWEEIPFNENDYNVYIDEIQYDFGNDMIIYRKDRYNNVVSGSNQMFVEFESLDGYGYGNPIKDFQWGCAQDNFNTDDYLYAGIFNNQVIDSYFETLNTIARGIYLNSFTSISYFYDNIVSKSSSFFYNTIDSNSYIENIKLVGNSGMYLNKLNINGYISQITLSENSKFTTILLSQRSGFHNSNFISCTITRNNLNSLSSLSFLETVYSQSITNIKSNAVKITINNLATIIFNPFPVKTFFTNESNISRLMYVNNSDVIVITDVNA